MTINELNCWAECIPFGLSLMNENLCNFIVFIVVFWSLIFNSRFRFEPYLSDHLNTFEFPTNTALQFLVSNLICINTEKIFKTTEVYKNNCSRFRY